MKSSYSFYKWFQKVISIFIDIFFVVAPVASLYVFTSPFSGIIRYALFCVLIVIYLLVVYFFKDKVKTVLRKILNRLNNIDERKMLLIIVLVMIILKTIYTVLFNYDATSDGDIEIYNEIADNIVSSGKIESNAISHLYGVGLHFALFKLLGLPLHIGLFIVVLIGTVCNFFSFKKVVGKEKAFIVVLLYVVMPSTVLMSFCPTHEVFVYMYVSIFLMTLITLINNERLLNEVLLSLACVVSATLTCLVNPGGYIICVILLLCVALTNLSIRKKVILLMIFVLTLLGNGLVSNLLHVNEYNTTMNTYTILIHGSNPHSLGEQVDGYPLKQMRMYIHTYTNDFSAEGFNEAARHVLIGQYKYLFTHPLILLKLVLNKIYILWSGVHYPIELAHHNNAFNMIINNIMLAINTFIYLFVITLKSIYKKTDSDSIHISIFKLEFLGVAALTMLCIVANKYALYVTVFIYLISMYRIGTGNEQDS